MLLSIAQRIKFHSFVKYTNYGSYFCVFVISIDIVATREKFLGFPQLMYYMQKYILKSTENNWHTSNILYHFVLKQQHTGS